MICDIWIYNLSLAELLTSYSSYPPFSVAWCAHRLYPSTSTLVSSGEDTDELIYFGEGYDLLSERSLFLIHINKSSSSCSRIRSPFCHWANQWALLGQRHVSN